MHEQHDNVDQTEIAKFEELASRWWDPDSEFKPLHEINPCVSNTLIGLPVYTESACLMGCGGGILAESMADWELT